MLSTRVDFDTGQRGCSWPVHGDPHATYSDFGAPQVNSANAETAKASSNYFLISSATTLS